MSELAVSWEEANERKSRSRSNGGWKAHRSGRSLCTDAWHHRGGKAIRHKKHHGGGGESLEMALHQGGD